jgi:hypothetical protein
VRKLYNGTDMAVPTPDGEVFCMTSGAWIQAVVSVDSAEDEPGIIDVPDIPEGKALEVFSGLPLLQGRMGGLSIYCPARHQQMQRTPRGTCEGDRQAAHSCK